MEEKEFLEDLSKLIRTFLTKDDADDQGKNRSYRLLHEKTDVSITTLQRYAKLES